MPFIEIVSDTSTWSTTMRVSRVPCIGEKVRPKVPHDAAGGAGRMECTVTNVSHLEEEAPKSGMTSDDLEYGGREPISAIVCVEG